MSAQIVCSGSGTVNLSGTGRATCTDPGGSNQLYGSTTLKPLVLGDLSESGDESTYEYTTVKGAWTYSSNAFHFDSSETGYYMFRRYTTSSYVDDIVAYDTTNSRWTLIRMNNAADDIETISNGYTSQSEFSPYSLTTSSETFLGSSRPDVSGVSGTYYWSDITDFTYNTATVTGHGTEYARAISPPGSDDFEGVYTAVAVGAVAFGGSSSPHETTVNLGEEFNGNDYVIFERQANGLFYYLMSSSLSYGFRCTDTRYDDPSNPIEMQFVANATSSTASVQADGRYYPSGSGVTLS